MEIYRRSRKRYWKYNYIRKKFCSDLNYYPLPDIKLNKHCLTNINNDPSLDILNVYICYTLDRWSKDLDTDFTLNNCLFASVTLTKNADPDKYKCSTYDVWFDSRSQFSFADESIGKNIIVFGADMSSSVHIDKKGELPKLLVKDQSND